MSDDEEVGEGHKSLAGEGLLGPLEEPIEQIIVEKFLSFEDASKCLNTLGKDESGMRYAYLMITATDRKLTNIGTILNFKHVLFVDISGNYLTLENLQVLTEMPYLILLKGHRNRIDSAALYPMPFLQVLDLSRNQILGTADINQPMVENLELNFNQIFRANFDSDTLPVLKQLELRGNYLPEFGGRFPVTVENLYLAENRITKVVPGDVSNLINLKVLHLRENQIKKLDGFSDYLVNLKYLNLRKNKITKVRQFRKLSGLPALEVLIILQNPVTGETGEAPGEGGGGDEEDEEEEKEDVLRIPLLILLPNLKRINKVPVTLEEREEAFETREEKLEEIMGEESSDDESYMPTSTEVTTANTTDVEDIDA